MLCLYSSREADTDRNTVPVTAAASIDKYIYTESSVGILLSSAVDAYFAFKIPNWRLVSSACVCVSVYRFAVICVCVCVSV